MPSEAPSAKLGTSKGSRDPLSVPSCFTERASLGIIGSVDKWSRDGFFIGIIYISMFDDRKKPQGPRDLVPAARGTAPTLREDTKVSERKSFLEKLKSLFRAERDESDPFNQFLGMLEEAQQRDEREVLEDIKSSYHLWAESYELLKSQFHDAWGLFLEVEDTIEGWFQASPNLGRWGPVGVDKFGYTFAAGVAKNYRRGAPLSEKSITVTFGMEMPKTGIGDERWLGRQAPISDMLTGLGNCSGKSVAEQYVASKKLLHQLQNSKFHFRMNHKDIGQKTSVLGIEILEENSLREICKGLFVGLNKDIMPSIDQHLIERNGPRLLE